MKHAVVSHRVNGHLGSVSFSDNQSNYRNRIHCHLGQNPFRERDSARILDNVT